MKTLLTLIVFTFMGCLPAKKYSLQEVQTKIASEWLYAFAMDEFKLNGVILERPPGISQLLFKLKLPSDNGLVLKTHCVYYQVPYKQIPGKLSIEEYKTERDCPETESEDSWVSLVGVTKFKATLENFHLHLDFEQSGNKVSWSILMANLDGALTHQKYQPQFEKKWKSGLTFLRTDSDTFLNQNNKYLGKLGDRMSRGTAIRCQQIDKNCNPVGENRCDDCRYGWYQVVDYNCPKGGSKFCGQNHCGEKGEPACPRGIKVVDEGEAGICQNDLTPVRNADHILICQ